MQLRSGVLALVPTLEREDVSFSSGEVAAVSAAGGAKQHGAGLLVALHPGRYDVWAEAFEIKGEWGAIAGRFRVVPAGRAVRAGEPLAKADDAPPARAGAQAAALPAGERRALEIASWDAIQHVDVSRDGAFVVAGEHGGSRICCWHADGTLMWQHALRPTPDRSRYARHVQVRFDPDGEHVMAVDYNDALARIAVRSGALTRMASPKPGARALRVAPGGERAVLRAGTDTWLLSYPQLEVIGQLDGYANRNDIAFTPDGTLVAVNGIEVHVYRVDGGEHVASVKGPQDPKAVAFSADGQRLAVAHGDGALRFYDAKKLEQHAPLDALDVLDVAPERTRKPEITCVAFSADARHLAVAGDDGAVRLFDAATLEPRATFAKHNTAIPDTGARRLSEIVFAQSSRWLLVSASLKKQPTAVSAYALSSR